MPSPATIWRHKKLWEKAELFKYMARKRMIDPSIWQDEEFGSLSANAKVLFIGLFSNADDEGRIRANNAYIKSTVFMYDNLSLNQIRTIRDEVSEKMTTVKLYQVNGKE